MKTCSGCNVEKRFSDFYKNAQLSDGHFSKCKECTKRDARNNRAAKAEYYRDYDKRRFKEDPRVLARRKRYAASPEGKVAGSRAKKSWCDRNTIKRAAHILTGNAVRDGRILKLDNCSECGASGRIHGHHDDYSKPLDVRWLCAKCHSQWHKHNIPTGF